MSSESLETRKRQKEKIEAEYKKRIETLTAAGVTGKEQGRDAMLRKAKAALKKANDRLRAIEAAKAHVQKTKEEKLAAKAAPQAKPAEKAKKGEGKPKDKPEKPKKQKPEKAPESKPEKE